MTTKVIDILAAALNSFSEISDNFDHEHELTSFSNPSISLHFQPPKSRQWKKPELKIGSFPFAPGFFYVSHETSFQNTIHFLFFPCLPRFLMLLPATLSDLHTRQCSEESSSKHMSLSVSISDTFCLFSSLSCKECNKGRPKVSSSTQTSITKRKNSLRGREEGNLHTKTDTEYPISEKSSIITRKANTKVLDCCKKLQIEKRQFK